MRKIFINGHEHMPRRTIVTPKLFHIFRNTPFGRETLLQSLYFCQMVGCLPEIYIPESTRFLMYFENDVTQVDLDGSYLTAPKTSREHAEALVAENGLKSDFLVPKNFTAHGLPDIPTHFDYMCCPRSISDLSSKIGLGHIGPRVRRIVKAARFPVLITSPVFKAWNSVTVFFGGSQNALNSLRLGIRIARQSGKPLNMFTQAEKGGADRYRQVVADAGLLKEWERYGHQWNFFDKGKLEENLYAVEHDALLVLGAYGHGLIKDFLFGSKMERIQGTLPNNLLIAGPKYAAVKA
jgi:nucleotide-binding universal stress UspA family protein